MAIVDQIWKKSWTKIVVSRRIPSTSCFDFFYRLSESFFELLNQNIFWLKLFTGSEVKRLHIKSTMGKPFTIYGWVWTAHRSHKMPRCPCPKQKKVPLRPGDTAPVTQWSRLNRCNVACSCCATGSIPNNVSQLMTDRFVKICEMLWFLKGIIRHVTSHANRSPDFVGSVGT